MIVAYKLFKFDDNGKVIGSDKSKYAKIWLNTQTWAVMSGVAEGERAVTIMDNVKKYLDTKYGIVLFHPAYKEYEAEVGYVSVYPAGLKENGGIFCHSNPWAMIAETKLGRGGRALEYYKKILPATKNRIADVHQTEGYIYSQFITGRDNPNFGRARNSWLTGTAAWNMVAISQYILGVRPEYTGLLVDPCIPKSWRRYRVRRAFRKAAYDIEIYNPKGLSRGVKTLLVDGKQVKGNVVPDFGDKKTHRVKVVLGK